MKDRLALALLAVSGKRGVIYKCLKEVPWKFELSQPIKYCLITSCCQNLVTSKELFTKISWNISAYPNKSAYSRRRCFPDPVLSIGCFSKMTLENKRQNQVNNALIKSTSQWKKLKNCMPTIISSYPNLLWWRIDDVK